MTDTEAKDGDVDWEETDLWKGIQDAKDDNFVRPDRKVHEDGEDD